MALQVSGEAASVWYFSSLLMLHKNRALLLAILTASNLACAESTEFKVCNDDYLLDISEKWVSVEKNGIEILRKPVPADLGQSAFIADFNFDKNTDFAVIRDSGIERYFDVYLFDKKRGGYFPNK